MAITKEQVEQFNNLEVEKSELTVELRRINAFMNRKEDNKDNQRAIDKGKIFVKFAGTACKLPVSVFNTELRKRKKECEERLAEIETELENL